MQVVGLLLGIQVIPLVGVSLRQRPAEIAVFHLQTVGFKQRHEGGLDNDLQVVVIIQVEGVAMGMQHGGTALASHGEHALLFEPALGGIVVVDELLVVEVVGRLGDILIVLRVVTCIQLKGFHVGHLIDSLQGIDDTLITVGGGRNRQEHVFRHTHAFSHFYDIFLGLLGV